MLERLWSIVWLFFYIGKPSFDYYLRDWQTDETGLVYDPVQMRRMVKDAESR